METKIKFQAEVISELEDKIKSCSEEIKKVNISFFLVFTLSCVC